MMDLNGDGKNDVYFYKVKPATQVAGVTYINVAETPGQRSQESTAFVE